MARLTVRSQVLHDQSLARPLAELRRWYISNTLEIEQLEITDEDCARFGLTKELLDAKEIEAESWVPFVLRLAFQNNWQSYREHNRNIYLTAAQTELEIQAEKAGRNVGQALGRLVDIDLEFAERILAQLQIQIEARLPMMEPKDMIRFYDMTMRRMAQQQRIYLEYQKWLKVHGDDGSETVPEQLDRLLKFAKEKESHSILAFMAQNLQNFGDAQEIEDQTVRRLDSEAERLGRLDDLGDVMTQRLKERRGR